jgi:membrane peptidoglycan carboxypeptidase
MSSRTTNLGGIISLLGAFLASAMVLGLLLAGLLMPAVGATGALARSGVDVFEELPSEFTSSPLSQQSKILTADGKTVIATPQEENRIIVPLSKISPIMQKAQIAIEDHRFYEHGGVDLQGIIRAAISNLRSGTVQGASSLTQQYVKISQQYSALLAGDEKAARAAVEKDYMRKLKELKYAVTLEKRMSKDQILEGYLNLVYYGDQAYGVEAAAQHFFSVSAAKLSLSQAAMLAGLTQNPGTTDPINYPNRAIARRDVVLERMYSLGTITKKQYDAAKARTLKQDLKVSQPKSSCVASPYPYWCDFLINYIGEMPELGKTREERLRQLYRGGLTITSTLDPKMQRIIQEEVTRKVPIGDKSGVGAAAYMADPTTGKVLAFAQNTSFTVAKQTLGKTGVGWALDKKYGASGGFQFGSTAKAFALVTAMESGMNTRSSVNAKAASDSTPAVYRPREFPQPCGLYEPWRVRNDSAWKGGTLSLMEATAKSTNTAFVALSQRLGGCKVRDTMIRLGLHRADGTEIGKIPADYILGASSVSPQGVAHAYSTLANDGKKCPMVAVTKIVKAGKELKLKPSKCEEVVKPDAVRATHKFLEYNMIKGSGQLNKLDDGRRHGNNESWFVGYTPQLVTAVWVGTPDDPGNRRVMKNVVVGGKRYPVMHGASIAAPIWKGIMNRAHQGKPRLKFPEPSAKLMKGDLKAIPRVTGMSVEDATARLEAAGFSAAVGGTMASSVQKGRVAATSPYGRAPEGSAITIYVSEGGSSRDTPKPPGDGGGGGSPDPTKPGKPGRPG